MMKMYFNFTKYIEPLLFQNINIRQTDTLVAALIVLIVLAILNELLKSIRTYLYKKTIANPLTQAKGTNAVVNEHNPLLESLRIPPTVGHIKRRRLKLHVGNSLFYLLEIIIGYLLMLSVMTFNGYILVAVVCGLGLGYFLFGTPRETFNQPIVIPETQRLAETDDPDSLQNSSLGRSYQTYDSLES
ncbi:protein SLC31A2-like [Glandiceps talaboti]